MLRPLKRLVKASKKKGGPTKGILLKGVFIPKLLNNPLRYCSFINLDFPLSDYAHFDKSIILPFLVFTTFGFLISVFLYTSDNMITSFRK